MYLHGAPLLDCTGCYFFFCFMFFFSCVFVFAIGRAARLSLAIPPDLARYEDLSRSGQDRFTTVFSRRSVRAHGRRSSRPLSPPHDRILACREPSVDDDRSTRIVGTVVQGLGQPTAAQLYLEVCSELEVALWCEARGKHHHVDITVVDPGSA